MQIKLKSNRDFLVYMLLPVFIAVAVVVGLMLVAMFINYEIQKEATVACICLVCFDVLLLIGIIIIKFYKGRSYEFNNDTIAIYKKNKKIDEIYIKDIQKIEYIRFRFLQAILGFFGGGIYTWTLDIEMKNGVKMHIGFFSYNNVQKLKNELYGDLIKIV